MDTILTLEGEIGRENLSTQGKKRISTYHSLKKRVANLEKAYKGADEKEKDSYEQELDEASEYFNNYSKATMDFLQDELDDIKAKQKAKEEKLRLKKEREDKEQSVIDEKAKQVADEKLKATEIENLAKPDAKDQEKKSSGVTGILFGGLVLVATLGAVNYFRNKD